jgi:TonB-linked SusC/RagA family outer membrane protein
LNLTPTLLLLTIKNKFMKKNDWKYLFNYPHLLQMLRIMKLTAVLLLIGILKISAGVFSQDAIISFNLENGNLTDLFNIIENNTEYKIFYKTNIISEGQKINLQADQKPVAEILSTALSGQNLTFDLVDKVIIITSLGTANQPIKITGTITDESGNPLAGSYIQVEGTSIGTVTDLNGNYSLDVPNENSVLVFTFVGYNSQRVSAFGKTIIDIQMIPSIETIEEIVVVGYGTQQKMTLTGAVATVGEDELRISPNISAAARLQGRVAGVTINNDNTPGGVSRVRVRGIGSINNNDPLYVIDGVPTTGGLNYINPNDIKSVSILKDASSSAIYGSRAANGVIIITTLHGQSGKLKLSLSGHYGIQQVTGKFDLLNTKEYGELLWLENKNVGLQVGDPGWGHIQYGYGATPIIPDYIIPSGKMAGEVDESTYSYPDPYNGITKANKIGTDWLDELFRVAPLQEYNLTVSGGNEKSTYAFSAGYLDQDGTAIYTGLKRLSVRTNVDVKITNWLKVGENIGITYIDNVVGFRNNSEGSYLAYARQAQPIIPVYDIRGNFAGTQAKGLGPGVNIVAWAYRWKDNYQHTLDMLQSSYAQINFLKDFSFMTLLGVNYTTLRQRIRNLQNPEHSEPIHVDNLSEQFRLGTQVNWANTLNYKKTINGNHNINLLLGTESVNNYSEYTNASVSTFAFSNLDYMVLDAGEQSRGSGGNFDQWKTFSYFSRLNYDYRNKYLFEGVIRRDGSSRFSKDNRWGTFPAVSVGWRISEESFLENMTWINDLKLRFGWGKNGNDNVGNYNSYSTYRAYYLESTYNISGINSTSSSIGFHKYRLGNPEGKWESTTTTNIGIDASMFNNRFEVNLDIFNRKTSDMLYPDSRPFTWGRLVLPSVNIGEMKNTGWDLLLSYRGNIANDFKYNVNINLSHFNNEVIKLNENPKETRYGQTYVGKYFTATKAGQPVSAFYGYVAEGIFNTQAEVDAHAPFNPNQDGVDAYSKPGVLKYKDVNGDGIITPDDRTFIGDPNPDLSYGLNFDLQYKNWDMTMFFQGIYGNKICNVTLLEGLFNRMTSNHEKRRFYESWTQERYESGAKITVPMATNDSRDQIMQSPSSFFIEDGSYFRMKDLQIGYTLPSQVVSKLKIERLRVYLQATNLFLITKYSGFDPELIMYSNYGAPGNDLAMGIDAGNYPTPRIFMFGISLDF